MVQLFRMDFEKRRSNRILLTRNSPICKRQKLSVKGSKKIFHANRKQKQAGVTNYTYIRKNSLQINNTYKRQRTLVYNNKWPIQQEDVTIRNLYAPNTRTPRFIKQVLLDLPKDLATK